MNKKKPKEKKSASIDEALKIVAEIRTGTASAKKDLETANALLAILVSK